MIRHTLRSLASCALAWLATTAPLHATEPRDSARVFFFGNSLIHHLTDTDETTVPHWLALMARHDGRDFAANGRWGFPREFAAELPPSPQWHLSQVPSAWDGSGGFGDGRFDTIVLNPENFIQYDGAAKPYPNDNPDGLTPLGVTLQILDWSRANTKDQVFFIYEGWADLHPFADALPARPRELRRYYRHAQRGYAAWYDDYVARLAEARPDADIRLIPVGRVMARLLSEEPLSAIPSDALYSDLSPHGTQTTYLLAAMITYAGIFGVRPPAGLDLPDTIDPHFAASYEATARRIEDIMLTGTN
ncbi:hypothetical protein [Paracoccus rhizosphaerae]|uniref:T9SS C-terminal target domain-containing protein n=1 Tax=Paracoccus rhizosphaerae TaxID=1133347 RepID=A0ABV6CHT7_9RHOB|nr:hypothetical protein [Paracoccus rhizosphaerae]